MSSEVEYTFANDRITVIVDATAFLYNPDDEQIDEIGDGLEEALRKEFPYAFEQADKENADLSSDEEEEE